MQKKTDSAFQLYIPIYIKKKKIELFLLVIFLMVKYGVIFLDVY